MHFVTQAPAKSFVLGTQAVMMYLAPDLPVQLTAYVLLSLGPATSGADRQATFIVCQQLMYWQMVTVTLPPGHPHRNTGPE